MLTKNTDQLRIEVRNHLAADALVRGQYWNDGKGCFIGCLTHSDDPKPAFERFGLPVAVLRIAEGIFEALPDDEGKAFFAAFPDAVERDGKDLSLVHWAFLAAELRALPPQPADVQAVIGPIIAGMDVLAGGKTWGKDAARAAAYAANAAYDAATDAAYAAARAATYAADAADAAYDAARAAARSRQRDTLLRLVKEAV